MRGRRAVVGLCLSVAVAVVVPSHEQEAEKGSGEELGTLARHRDPDGHWGIRSYVKQCKKGATCGPGIGDERYDTHRRAGIDRAVRFLRE